MFNFELAIYTPLLVVYGKNVLQTVIALIKTRPKLDRFIHLCCGSQSCQAYKNNDFLNSTEVKRELCAPGLGFYVGDDELLGCPRKLVTG